MKFGNPPQKRTINTVRSNLFPDSAKPVRPAKVPLFTENPPTMQIQPAWRDPLRSISEEGGLTNLFDDDSSEERSDEQALAGMRKVRANILDSLPTINENSGKPDLVIQRNELQSAQHYTAEEKAELGLD